MTTNYITVISGGQDHTVRPYRGPEAGGAESIFLLGFSGDSISAVPTAHGNDDG